MLWREESRQRSLPTLQRGRRQTAREVIFNVDLKPCIVFHRYNCLSGCIYKDEEDPQGVRLQNYKWDQHDIFLSLHSVLPVETFQLSAWTTSTGAMKETADLSSGRHASRFTSELNISIP